MQEDLKNMEELEGSISSVIYQNEENGYCVLRLEHGLDEITIVGTIPGAVPGEQLRLKGRWTRHNSYGEQFKAEVVERCLPSGTGPLIEYLASGAIPGVGLATARKLVSLFGEDVLDIIENDPDQLTQIKGITKKRARDMSEGFRARMGIRKLLEYLNDNGLPTSLGMPLYRHFSTSAVSVLEANPYMLSEPEFGVDFEVADTFAAKLGIASSDPQRIAAGILFELTYNLGNGHSFLPRRKLIPAACQLLVLEETDMVEEELDKLIELGQVVSENIAGENACYLARLYEDECYVAMRLSEMTERETLPPKNLNAIIDRIQAKQKIQYAEQQREAVELAARSQVMLLTGGPGTGKTTSLRGVLALFDQMGLQTALAAPTGRAAKRLGDLCDSEASTIHRLLETQYDTESGLLVFSHNEDDPLTADAVIIDESSMVDISLMHALMAALKSECRLVLVGDPDQLPSVGPGALLQDMIRSKRIPTVRLTEVFRQAAESAIIRNAHGINKGTLPPLTNKQNDFFYLKRLDGESAANTIVDLVSRRLPQNMGIPASEIQVLSPTRKYKTGTVELNKALQAALNPPAEGKGERKHGDTIFRQGDRVMQVRNNYDIIWRDENGNGAGMGIFNGDIGHIMSIGQRQDAVLIDFDGRIAEYSSELLSELELAYAVTVHKSQGSEYRAVVLAALDGAPMLMTRGILYTAITRAKELFVAVGDENKLLQMVANNKQEKRYSGLCARLMNF